MAALAVTRPAFQSADDMELVAAVRDGDERAFERLFERYQARVAAYVWSTVRDHGRAEDITQDVFIAALRRMRATDREIAFKPWIFEIAKNACIDSYRRGRNTHEVSFDADDAFGPADRRRLAAIEASPDAVMDRKVALDDLCGAFGGLSPTHHEILVKRELEGLSYREIGEQLCMSQGAVESTLFRARRRLGEEYEEISSGERCVRVRAIADAAGGRALGARERRRMSRHVARCRPCLRHALHAGVDLGAPGIAGSRAARVAALLPLPAFLRRRAGADPVAGHLLGSHSHLASIAGSLDPAAASGWGKAAFAAATVAVAGMGAGVAVDDHRAGRMPDAPAIVSPTPDRSAAGATSPVGPRGTAESRASRRSTGARDPDVTSIRPRRAAEVPAADSTAGTPPPRGAQGQSPGAAKSPPTAPGQAPGEVVPPKTAAPKRTADHRRPLANVAGSVVHSLRDLSPAVGDAGSNAKRPGIVKAILDTALAGIGVKAHGAGTGDASAAAGGASVDGPSAGHTGEGRPPATGLRPGKIVGDLVGALTAGRR